MQYAVLDADGSFGHQVTTAGNIEWDENNFCTAAALIKDGKAEQFRVVELHETNPPQADPITQMVVRDGGEFVNGRWQYKWRVENYPPELAAANLVTFKSGLTREIDAAVAAITARYAPFLEEYKTREAQARAFAAADFTGPVPQQVAAFATPAGKTPTEATQTIIAQADGLRTASDALGVQRMRKYEVLRAATDAEALAAHANVMVTIAAIGAQIG